MITRTIETAPICDALGKPIAGAKATLISERSPIWAANNQTFLALPVEAVTDSLGVARWTGVPIPAQEGWVDGVGGAIRDWSMSVTVATPPRAPDLPDVVFALADGSAPYVVGFDTSELRTAGVVTTVDTALAAEVREDAAAVALAVQNLRRGQPDGVPLTDPDGRVRDAVTGSIIDSRATTDLGALYATADRYSGIYRAATLAEGFNLPSSLPAFLQSIRDTPDGGHLVIPSGVYKLSNIPIPGGGPLDVVGNFTNNRNPDGTLATPKSITIDAYGATFIQNNDQPCVDMWGSTGTPWTVTGVTEAQENTSALGGDGDLVPVLTYVLTHPEGQGPVAEGWTLGDIVKDFAEDEIPRGRHEEVGDSQRRVGVSWKVFRVIVVDAVTTQVKVIGSMRRWIEDGTVWTDNRRMVRFGRERVTWRGGEFTTTLASLATKHAGFIRYTALSHSGAKDVIFRQMAGTGITPRGCYNCTFENVTGEWATNAPGSGRAGYLVNDQSSSYCKYINLFGHMVRHTFTDDSPAIPIGQTDTASLASYGSSVGWHVSDSTAVANVSAGFSPHAQSRWGKVTNSHVVESGSGFGARGFGHIYDGVSWTDCNDGFTAFSEDDWNTGASGMTLLNATGRNTKRSDLRFNKNRNANIDLGTVTTTPKMVFNKTGVPYDLKNTSGTTTIYVAATSAVSGASTAIAPGATYTTTGANPVWAVTTAGTATLIANHPNYGQRDGVSDRVQNLTIINATEDAFYLNNETLVIDGVTIYLADGVTDSTRIIDMLNSAVRNQGDLTVFSSGLSAGTGLALIRGRKVSTHGTATAGNWQGGTIRMYGSAGQFGRFSRIETGDADFLLRSDFWLENPSLETSGSPAAVGPARFFTARGSTTKAKFETGAGPSSAYVQAHHGVIQDNGFMSWLQTNGESMYVLACAPTSSRTLATLLEPNRTGQIVHILNEGSASMTVANTATMVLTGAADRTLAPGERIQVQWTNGAWRQF